MACWPRLPLADAVSRWLVGRLRKREAAAGRRRQPLAGWPKERESLGVRLSSELRRRKCPGTPDRFVVSAQQDYEV